MIRKLFLFCLLAFSLRGLWCEAQPVRYSLALKHWGEYYFPSQDWRWWRTQAQTESGIDQSRVSAAGAIGIMQLMQGTARELGVDPYDAEANIRGGIRYDRILWDQWANVPSEDDRRNIMFASYNAGPGNIARASRLANSLAWAMVSTVLPKVTGPHAAETVAYVQRINAGMGR